MLFRSHHCEGCHNEKTWDFDGGFDGKVEKIINVAKSLPLLQGLTFSLLDGVFNHTGSNSRYFNAEGFYPELGAAQSQDSLYFDWYSFHPWPTDYDAWSLCT